MLDELLSIGLRYVKRTETASGADKYYWVEIQDKKLAQKTLEFIKMQSNKPLNPTTKDVVD